MALENRPAVFLALSWAFVLVVGSVSAGADSVPSTSRAWERRSGPADIAPPGWHREGARWERSDGAPLPAADPSQTINDLIRRQRSLETESGPTRLLASLMMYLRLLDPITLASAQISAFCLLAYRVLRRE